jgi:hypothetical protein
MSLHERLIAETHRRTAVLGRQLSAWRTRAAAGGNDWGLHKSQLDAISVMMEVLETQQVTAANGISPGLAPSAFAESYLACLRVIVGVDELWRVFGDILRQRLDDSVKETLRAADLTAAGCYRDGLSQPRAWRVIDESALREPPLVMLDAELSPAMVGRGGKVELLGAPVRTFREQRLPVPVVTLPFDHVDCFWLVTTVHHEVGHVLDQDLKLGNELAAALDARMTGTVPHQRARFWGLWGEEILADAFGVLFGGAGYAITISSLAMALAPSVPQLDGQDVHPHFALRTPLVAAMLRRLGVPSLTSRAQAIVAEWRQRGSPAWVDDFVQDCDLVAEVYLDAPLTALGDRSTAAGAPPPATPARPLRSLVPTLAQEVDLTDQLAVFLRTGFNSPEPASVPWRLVPAAAQLAAADVPAGDAAALGNIDAAARAFLARIPPPTWLGATAREPAWRAQAQALSF